MGLTLFPTKFTFTVDPLGTPQVLNVLVKHYQNSVGSKPGVLVVSLTNYRPCDIVASAYQGKFCQLKAAQGTSFRVFGSPVVYFQGTIQRIEKVMNAASGELEVYFTILDARWNINSSYVGADLLETLDTTVSSATYGLPLSFSNGLVYYGADVVFNLNGLPNKAKGSTAFSPPGYEHSTAYADYWRYVHILEYIWENWIATAPISIAYPLPTAQYQAKTVAASGTSGSGSFNVTFPFGIPWAAYSTDGWLTTTATGTGTGSPQSVAYSWAANADTVNSLSGAITVVPSFGGLDKKAELIALTGKPLANALDEVFKRTRSSWTVGGDGTPKIFSIDNPTSSLALNILNPSSPGVPTSLTPIAFRSEISTDDAVGRLDVIGAREQREVLFGVSDFTQTTCLDLQVTGDFSEILNTSDDLGFGIVEFANAAKNVYLKSFYNQFGVIVGTESTYRYNLNTNIFESHYIGKNINSTDQPYKMLGQLLIARDKNGNYCNPDLPTAWSGVSPQELLKAQYQKGLTIDLDRGFIEARGISPYPATFFPSIYLMNPPFWEQNNPQKFTVAFECAYRAYQSAVNSVTTASPLQVRRAVFRDELIHKTREATQVVMPMSIAFGSATYAVTEYSQLPVGATRNYSTGGVTLTDCPLNQQNMTINLPAGTIVDGMAELKEIRDSVDPYIGLSMINGQGTLPSIPDITTFLPGVKISDATNQYDLTGIEVIIATSFSDTNQATDFAFTNRLGVDIMEIANQFVDTRRYQRPI